MKQQRRLAQRAGIFILVGLLMFVAGTCFWLNQGDWIYPDQPQTTDLWRGVLSQYTAVGQTFTAYQAGLTAIEIKVNVPLESPSTLMALHLQTNDAEKHNLAVATSRLQTGEQWVRFSFPAISTSRLRDFYFYLESVASDELGLYGAPADAYLDGAAYLDHQPYEGQLAFRLVYQRSIMLFDLVQRVVAAIPPGVVVTLLLICPGGGMMAWLWPKANLDWFGWLQTAIGISLALFPVLFVLYWLVGGTLFTGMIWIWIILGGGLIVWRISRGRLWLFNDPNLKNVVVEHNVLLNLTLIILATFIIGSRLAIIQSGTVPFWGDSVQHAVIAQRMVEQGGIFSNWLPYAPFETLTIHFGFHTFVATLTWLIEGNIAQRTLLAGQIINMVAVFSLYPLVVRLTKHRWAGVATLLIAGLLMPMPMYYVNWGRYPQLMGQAILPVALWLGTQTLSEHKLSWHWVLTAIVAAGLFLTYYRMPIFFVIFIGIWLIWFVKQHYDWTTLQRVVLAFAGMAAVGGLILWPWLNQVQQGRLASMALSAPPRTSADLLALTLQELKIWQEILFYTWGPALLVAGSGIIWAVIRRQGQLLVVLVWYLILVASPFARFLPIPGARFVQAFTVIIAIYMPLGLLGGWLLGELITQVQKRSGYLLVGLIGISLLTGLWMARVQLSLLDRNFQMAFAPDKRAMAWLQDHTPPQSRFFVDGFTVYNDSSIVGSDAGWWLPLLAQRENTMPPQYALLNEQPITPSYSYGLVELMLDLREITLASKAGIALLKSYGVTHIYLGQAQGKVNNPHPLIDPHALQESRLVDLIYHQDRVWIFALPEGKAEVD